MRVRALVAFLALMVLVGCATPIRLTCMPTVANSSMFRPAMVTAVVRVNHPDERLWCSGVRWEVEQDGIGFRGMGAMVYRAEHESDCPSYQQVIAEQGNLGVWSETESFALFTGTYLICAHLVKNGKSIASDTCTVSVR